MIVKSTRMRMAATQVGKGSDETSPPMYDAAVAAETIDVDPKSRRRSAAPTKAKVLVDTLRLDVNSEPEHFCCSCRSHVGVRPSTYWQRGCQFLHDRPPQKKHHSGYKQGDRRAIHGYERLLVDEERMMLTRPLPPPLQPAARKRHSPTPHYPQAHWQ